jgi:hypothetical protein
MILKNSHLKGVYHVISLSADFQTKFWPEKVRIQINTSKWEDNTIIDLRETA